MRPGSNAQLIDDKSITLISSVAGFKDSPGLFAYSASKHGVMGLMRSLRGYLPSTFNVRINVVCPWATDTEMISGVRDIWFQNSLPVNSPGEVARIILQCNGDKNIHGKAIYVAGGKGFDIEEGINRTEPDWLGEKQAIDLEKGQQVLGTVGISAITSRSIIANRIPLGVRVDRQADLRYFQQARKHIGNNWRVHTPFCYAMRFPRILGNDIFKYT